jgi:SAM-dependent methyltransferase
LVGVDPSEAYLAAARSQLTDDRVAFRIGDATSLPVEDASIDEAMSGLVLNFVAEPEAAVREIRRVLAPGGRATAYVWDYGEGMQMLRLFWDAAIAEDPTASSLDESRFPLRHEGALGECFAAAGMRHIEAGQIEIRTHFQNFDDYWNPLLGKQGPAPSYVAGLPDARRTNLRERLRQTLPSSPDGSIDLAARAWVCQGRAD